jgi:type III secretory pathway component EscV
MSIQPQAINEFIEKKVKDGSCSSVAEAEKEIITQLIERDIERQIKIGDQQIENGEYEILDDNYIDKFIARMAKKFLPKNI